MLISFYLFYRQLLSQYTLSQNPNVLSVENNPALHPLWVRCDMSDPAGTAWFGAETLFVGSKVSGVKLFSVNCKGKTQILHTYLTNSSLKYY